VETGVQGFLKSLKTLDSGFRRNDRKIYFRTFYEIIKKECLENLSFENSNLFRISILGFRIWSCQGGIWFRLWRDRNRRSNLKRLRGSLLLLECLSREGVQVIFGYPGGAVIQLYDELGRYPGLRHILVRHEQGAIHAADGYARATGKAGVCLVTSGPGATNLVTGLAAAHMDSIPIVAITGQVATGQLGNDAFQEVDILGMTRTCTKYSYLVRKTAEIPTVIHEAFWLATTGRPGPVLVDVPKDVLSGEARMEFPKGITLRGYAPHKTGHPLQVKKAVAEILKAKRPVIYAGGGIIHSGANEELRALAEKARIPVTLTLLGLGGLPYDHPLFLGMLGMHGTYKANMAVHGSDLLLALGSRFDDRATGNVEAFAPQAKIVHVDIDPSSISKSVHVDIPIVGDARIVLGQILQSLGELPAGRWREREPWLQQIESWGQQYPLYYEPSDTLIKPQYVIEQIHRLTGGEAIIATEVGQNQMWTAQYYGFRHSRQLLSSGGLGVMGYGLPAGIGAQTAFPERVVFDIAGDGSIQMNIQELATAVQYNLPVKVAVLNNRALGMVRQWQEIFFRGEYHETLLEVQPDFVKLAEAYGVAGLRATRPDEVVPCLREALSIPGPVLMDFHVDPWENVYPMVLPGRGISEMVMGPDQGPSEEETLATTLPA
jgi:acetolactate synthase-1/2/3 large subunit